MKVIIIGGGAAGMMAAYQAAKCGNDVSLYEKNEKLGKKIFITGKGRCNVTNACEIEELLDHDGIIGRTWMPSESGTRKSSIPCI